MSILRTLTYSLLCCIALISCTSGLTWGQPVVLSAPTSAGAGLGTNLAISEDWLVATAPNRYKDNTPSSIYIFKRFGERWVFQNQLAIPNESNRNGHLLQPVLSGNKLFVGSPMYSGELDRSGAVLVTSLPSLRWEHILEADPPRIGHDFGRNIASVGDTLLIGSSIISYEFETDFSPLTLFARSDDPIDTWHQASKISVPRSEFNLGLGESLSLSGSLAAVGSPEVGLPPTDDGGSVYLFRRDPLDLKTWKWVHHIRAEDWTPGDRFGYTVLLKDSLLLVGSPGSHAGSPKAGAVYIFKSDIAADDAWKQITKITAPDGASQDGFGTAVAFNDHYLVVGAPNDDGTAQNSGTVYVFESDQQSNHWHFKALLKPPTGQAHQRFGSVLALQGKHLVVSVPNYLDTSGILYTYDLSSDFNKDRFAYDALLESDPVSQIWQDSTGFVWMGTWRGLIRYDGYSQKTYLSKPDNPFSISHNAVLALLQDREGNLWVGTEDGLNRYDFEHDHFIHYPVSHDSVYPRQSFVTIFEDKEGTVWTGSNGRLYQYHSQQDRFLEFIPFSGMPDELREPYISGIQQDSLGFLWVLTKHLWEPHASLYRIDLHNNEIYRFQLADSWGQVGPFFIDSRNRFWIKAPSPVIIPPDNSGILYPPSGVDLTPHWGFYEDHDGTVWIGTQEGLYRLGPNQSVPSHHKLVHSSNFRDSPNWVLTFYRDQTNSLLLGTHNGLLRTSDAMVDVSTSGYLEPARVSPIALTNIEISSPDGTSSPSIYNTQELRLSHDDYSFSLEFAALDYVAPDQIRYRYQLQGYDHDWIISDLRRFAMYTNVPPGSYTFRVEAERDNGAPVGLPLAFPVSIAPPFWEMIWFRILMFTVLIGILTIVYRTHVNRLLEAERIRNLAREKQQSEAEAKRLAELDQMKSRFFANITHEFRTPLTLIIGPLQDALKGHYGAIPDVFRERLTPMLQSSKQLHKLINQLLDLSKLETDTLQIQNANVDLVVELSQLVRTFQPLAERNRIKLHFRSSLKSCVCLMDLEKISTIVSNLVSNALKFTLAEGKVWVSLEEFIENSGSGHKSIHPIRTVQIIIKDTGPGILPSDLNRIFDRFEQVHTSSSHIHEGTGIGLSLARELTYLLSGQLLVESEPGFGTAFIVRLPLTSAMGEVPQAEIASDETSKSLLNPYNAENQIQDSHQKELSVDRPKVLIVEDHVEVRALLRSQLHDSFHILEADHGEVALEMVRQDPPDLILCDVMMPVMNGIQLCKTIKEDPYLKTIPVVLLSAFAEEENIIEGLEAGADDYITKPYHSDSLKSQLSNMIDARIQMRSRFSRELVLKPANIVIGLEDEIFVKGLHDIIENQIENSGFSVDQLANAVGLSTRQLYRRIHSISGQTPGQLIRAYRLQKAHLLLETRPGSISEVGFAVGFKSPSHFSASFREMYGYTPTELVSSLT